MTSEDLVTVAAYLNPIEAHILRTRLESEDIPCLIANEMIINSSWSNACGGVQVRVRPQDVERAREILKEAAEQ